MSDIKTLINTALNQKPAEFTSAFNELLLNRARDAVEIKKTDLAQNIFNVKPSEEIKEPEESTDA